MRTSKRVTLDVNTVQQFFALFRDHRGTRILFQSLDLELHCDPENLKVVEVLHQLLNACVRKVSCERVDWDQRDEPAREIGEEFAPGQLCPTSIGWS